MDINKWLIQDYPSLGQCLHDNKLVYVTGALCLLIVLGYLVIAIQWFMAKRGLPKRTASALQYLLYIFVFCDLAGYGFRFASIWWPGYRLLPILLILLCVATWTYIFLGYPALKRGLAAQALGERLQAELDKNAAKLSELERFLGES